MNNTVVLMLKMMGVDAAQIEQLKEFLDPEKMKAFAIGAQNVITEIRGRVDAIERTVSENNIMLQAICAELKCDVTFATAREIEGHGQENSNTENQKAA